MRAPTIKSTINQQMWKHKLTKPPLHNTKINCVTEISKRDTLQQDTRYLYDHQQSAADEKAMPAYGVKNKSTVLGLPDACVWLDEGLTTHR